VKPKNLILKSIKLYQNTSVFQLAIFKKLFLTDAACRFIPTCSEYFYQAIEKYGIIKGTLLGLRRIFKCHPWSKGGEEPLL